MQMQVISLKSKFSSKHRDIILIQIDLHLEVSNEIQSDSMKHRVYKVPKIWKKIPRYQLPVVRNINIHPHFPNNYSINTILLHHPDTITFPLAVV